MSTKKTSRWYLMIKCFLLRLAAMTMLLWAGLRARNPFSLKKSGQKILPAGSVTGMASSGLRPRGGPAHRGSQLHRVVAHLTELAA